MLHYIDHKNTVNNKFYFTVKGFQIVIHFNIAKYLFLLCNTNPHFKITCQSMTKRKIMFTFHFLHSNKKIFSSPCFEKVSFIIFD